MKSEKLYEDWKRHRSQVEVGDDFNEKVMGNVYAYEKKQQGSLFSIQRLVEAVSAHRWVQAAMIFIGAVVGFVRLAVMLHVLLYT